MADRKGCVLSLSKGNLPTAYSGTVPIKGETYFYQQRPVVVMKIGDDGRCLIRQGNSSKNLDVWVTW